MPPPPLSHSYVMGMINEADGRMEQTTATVPAKKQELSPLHFVDCEASGRARTLLLFDSPPFSALCCPLRLRPRWHLLSVKMKTCQEMRSRSFLQRSRRSLMFAQCPDRQADLFAIWTHRLHNIVLRADLLTVQILVRECP